MADELGTTAFPDLDGLLDQVQAVTVAVPTKAHHEVGARALSRGVPVLMEKPLASTVAEADLLIAVAARAGLQLQVGHIERYNRALRAAEAYLDAPRYIESQRLAPFQPRGTDVQHASPRGVPPDALSVHPLLLRDRCTRARPLLREPLVRA